MTDATSSGQPWGPDEVGVLDYPDLKVVMECLNEFYANWRIPALQKEPWMLPWLQSMEPGKSIFYDIGACVGSYSLPAAMRGITTVAVEPSAPNYGSLIRNAMLNNCLESMMVFPFALAAGHGLAWLDYSDVRPGAASHVMGSADKIFYHRQRVAIFALDELIEVFNLPAPTHMKIDTDGGEQSVLTGMEKTLRNSTLVSLMVEMPSTAEAPIVAHLTERGLALAERFTEREGVEIKGVVYGRFERVAVAVEAEGEPAAEAPKRARKRVAVPA